MPPMLRKLCVCVFVPLFFFVSVFALTLTAQDSRHFTFHYAFTIKNVPAGKKIRLWIPSAQSDANQEVKVISVKGDLPLKKARESRFGNEMYFAETNNTPQPELHFDVEYDVIRHERVTLTPSAHVIAAAL